MVKRLLFSIVTIILLLGSCSSSGGDKTSSSDYRGSLLILNTLSEDISSFKDNRIENHVAPADAGANRMVIYGGELIVINSLSNSISVYDSNLSLLYEESTGTGTNPFDGTILDDRLYITAYLKDEIIEMEQINGKWQISGTIGIKGDLPTDPDVTTRKFAPMGICEAGGKIFVALANLDENSVAAGPGGVYMRVGTDWDIMEVRGRDTVNVTNIGDNKIAIISAGDYVSGTGFQGDGKIEIYDYAKMEFSMEIDIPGAPFTVTGPISGHYFVSNAMEGNVFVYDTDWHQVGQISVNSSTLSMVSDLVIFDNMVAGLEFNSNTLFLVNPTDLTIEGKFSTGDGPISLINFTGG